jgi:hypothetical protein
MKCDEQFRATKQSPNKETNIRTGTEQTSNNSSFVHTAMDTHVLAGILRKLCCHKTMKTALNKASAEDWLEAV